MSFQLLTAKEEDDDFVPASGIFPTSDLLEEEAKRLTNNRQVFSAKVINTDTEQEILWV